MLIWGGRFSPSFNEGKRFLDEFLRAGKIFGAGGIRSVVPCLAMASPGYSSSAKISIFCKNFP